MRTSAGSFDAETFSSSESASESATEVAAVTGDESREGEDSSRSRLKSLSVLNCSDSETLRLLPRLRETGAGLDFFGGRPRPRLAGKISRSLVFRKLEGTDVRVSSSAEESLSSTIALTALRFRDGVEVDALVSEEGVIVHVEIASVFPSLLPMLFDTRVNLFMLVLSSCFAAKSLDLTAGRWRFTAAGIVKIF